MARPQKQTVDFFPHYATSGKTLYILENKFGNDGYAFWFKLLELLATTNGHYFRVENEVDWEFLLAKTKVSAETATEILNTLANLDAIDKELWQEKIIWSQNFVNNLSEVYRKRRISVPEKPVCKSFRPENPSKNDFNGDSDAETLQSRVEESRVKESKVEESNNTDVADVGADAVAQIEKLWGRPISSGEAEAITKWCDDFALLGSSEPDNIVAEGAKRAMEHNVKTMAYMSSILRDWHNKGITSMAHIESLDAEWRAKKDKGKSKTPGGEIKTGKAEPGKGKYEEFYLS